MSNRLPPLNAIRFFEVTARHMSFKKAAAELCVTPAAVSHQIRCLEESLGVPLFVRSKGGIELTEAGMRCLPGVREGFECLSRAMNDVRQADDSNVLVVTAGPAFITKWLLPRLTLFRKAHPHIDVRIVASLAIQNLEQEGIDLAIRFGQRPKEESGAALLVEESVVPMCSPALLDAHPNLLSADGLNACSLIHDKSLKAVAQDTPDWKAWLETTGIRGVDDARGLRFNQADHALQSAIEGAGVLLGRRVLAEQDLLAGRLVIPGGPELRTGLWFHVLAARQAAGRAIVQTFQRWLLDSIPAGGAELPSVSPS